MEKRLIISDFIKNGLTECNGLIIREKIEQILKEIDDGDIIILNFNNITLFATPFFNSSIGYILLKLGPKKFDEIFKLEEISELGKNTYQHSYENAVEIYTKQTDTNMIGQITKNNIQNS